jgi:hypothetical protein
MLYHRWQYGAITQKIFTVYQATWCKYVNPKDATTYRVTRFHEAEDGCHPPTRHNSEEFQHIFYGNKLLKDILKEDPQVFGRVKLFQNRVRRWLL